ncbi:MAG: hypothetical protein H0T89_25215 [Deltaproteobacteria bacterium]|nr:hypothetical protein [Deltaproteobacteria bacterium]
MGIFSARPQIEVFAPTTIVVGRPALIQVVVTAAEETKIEHIALHARGKQGWVVGSGKSRVAHDTQFPALVARLMEAGVLAEGATRFSTSITVPAGTAPTHAMDPAHATFELFVHVSIPWRLDARRTFLVPVRVAAPGEVTRTPVVLRSTSGTDKPRLEVSLASRRLIAGETVVGSCAVFHLDDSKPREIDLSLVPTLKLHGRGRVRERRGRTYDVTVTLPAGSAGTSVPFHFRLAPDMTPTFTTVSHELAWALVARSGSFFSTKVDVTIPLELVDSSAAATTAQLTAAPELADERVTAVFEAFAAKHGWQVVTGDAASGGQPQLVRALDDSELRIAYAYRGEEGTFLVARVAHPALGLDLTVTPSSSLRHVFFRDLEIDITAWDRAHHVGARSPEQAIPFLRAAVPAVLAATRVLGPVVRWDDDAVVCEQAVVWPEPAKLAELDLALQALAHAIDGARPTITMPPGITAGLADWQQLAHDLRGRLTVGELAIDGRLDNQPVSVGLVWDGDGKPYGLRAHVGDPVDASGEVRAIAVALSRPAADALAASTPEALVAQLVAWPADIVDLQIADGVASAWRPITGGSAEADAASELVRLLRALLAALEPAAGPYR